MRRLGKEVYRLFGWAKAAPNKGQHNGVVTGSYPIRLAQRVLPAMIVLVVASGIINGIRLGLCVGQPLPGFLMMWRVELRVLSVGHYNLASWPGMRAGVRVNDHILCIDGYAPCPDCAIYTLEPIDKVVSCPHGSWNYVDLFENRFAHGARSVDFTVSRAGRVLTIQDVPLVRFGLDMLLESFLPFFVLGLSLVSLGWVVYRASPQNKLNLAFAALVTIPSGLIMGQTGTVRISHHTGDMVLTELTVVAPWLPLFGATLVYFTDLLAEPADRLRTRYPIYAICYGVSLLCSILGATMHIVRDYPIASSLFRAYMYFVLASSTAAGLYAIGRMVAIYRSAAHRRVRGQADLIIWALVVTLLLTVPYWTMLFSNSPLSPYIYSIPYLCLSFVILIAYSILRYQLFSSRARVLTLFIVGTFCIWTANVFYLLSPYLGFVSILGACLAVGLVLEMRQGPLKLLDPFLRRELGEYQTVVRFSRNVAQLKGVEPLLTDCQQTLRESLEAERVEIWLADTDRQSMEHLHEGRLSGPVPAMPALLELLKAQTPPLRAGARVAAPCDALAPAPGAISVWAPLADRGQCVGLLGLGPRWTGDIYDDQDLELVDVLGQQMALAILNTRQIEHLRALPRIVRQAEENERAKIAHELHDTILPFLAVLTFGLDELRRPTEQIGAKVDYWQEQISRQAAQLRNLLGYLRAPEVLVQRGLLASLQTWVAQYAESAVKIECDWDPQSEGVLSTETQVALYRVLREAVNNAIKHAQCSSVKVTLRRVPGAVQLAVEDDGHGFEVQAALQANHKGYSSLQDMRLYMESVGGTLLIQSMPGQGTRIVGQLPT